MNWAIELSAVAEKELKRLPRDRRARIIRAIDEMEDDPFAGDVKPLKGPEWKGRFRKRVGLPSGEFVTHKPPNSKIQFQRITKFDSTRKRRYPKVRWQGSVDAYRRS